MNRRGFLHMMVGGIAAGAAVRTFPFRVFSFPKEIVPQVYETEWTTFSDYRGWEKVTLHTSYIHFGKEGVWKTDSAGDHLISAKEISIEEAKLLFPDFGLLRDSSSPLFTSAEMSPACRVSADDIAKRLSRRAHTA